MKTLVVYDSIFGNTEKIARAIGNALGSEPYVEVRKVSDVRPEHLGRVKLLIVGSPTRGFRPTTTTVGLLKRIPPDGLKGVRVAAFDTGISMSGKVPLILRFMAKLFGYAAKPIADRLRKKGGILTIPPEGFFVEGTEGPLKDGELSRASEWAKRIRAQ